MGGDAGAAAAASLQDHWRPGKLLLAGALAGAVSRTATAPIDRLRMLFQVNTGASMTLAQGVRQMAAEGTVFAFFRGNGANCLKIAPETAIKFALNDRIKRAFEDPGNMRFHERVLCGGVAGGIAQGSIYPLETIRTRLAVSPPGTYRGIGHCAGLIVRLEGFKGLYRGVGASMAGIVPYAGTDIAVFEVLKKELLAHYQGREPPGYALVGAGMAASVSAQIVSYPFAFVRTRLQAQGMGGMPDLYKGPLDCVAQTVRNEGALGLYKGLLPNLLKLTPAAGISWFVFEKTKLALGISIST